MEPAPQNQMLAPSPEQLEGCKYGAPDLLHPAAVDHADHIVNCDRGLCHIGGHHNLALSRLDPVKHLGLRTALALRQWGGGPVNDHFVYCCSTDQRGGSTVKQLLHSHTSKNSARGCEQAAL